MVASLMKTVESYNGKHCHGRSRSPIKQGEATAVAAMRSAASEALPGWSDVKVLL